MQYIHRDDMDMEEVASIEAYFQELYPGTKLVFAGDNPERVPKEVLDSVSRILAKHRRSLEEGFCVDCGRTIDGYCGFRKLPEGWAVYVDQVSGKPEFLVCDQCDDANENARVLISNDEGDVGIIGGGVDVEATIERALEEDNSGGNSMVE